MVYDWPWQNEILKKSVYKKWCRESGQPRSIVVILVSYWAY